MEKTIGGKIETILILGLKNFLKIFPLKYRYKLFEGIGLLGYYLIKKRRDLTINNIKNAFPEKSNFEIIKIAKESYKTMGKIVMTSIYLDEITKNGNSYVENEEIIKKLSNENEKAIILVSLHLGGFEAGAIMNNIRPFYAVFRKQKNKIVNEFMEKWREKGGLKSIPLRENEMLNNVLRGSNILALASDHFGSDVEIEFFGRKTTAVSGPVLLALKHKIPLVLAYAVFEKDKIKVVNKKIIEIEKKENLKETIKYNMQQIYYEFEKVIKKYPEQYMWQHKRWRN